MASDQLARRPDPILVLGMHRSGTGAVSKLLHDAGISMGRRQEANGESRFFLRLNSWLIAQCGASWATVDPVPPLVGDHADLLADIIARRIRSRAAIEHFGFARRSRPWGFKDPRTSLLFPVYDRVFPNAKLVVVHRHGVDVAESLRVRARASMKNIGVEYAAPVLGSRQPGANRLQNALVAADLDRNFELWVRYQETLRSVRSSIEPSRVHLVRFEELVENPQRSVMALSDFVGRELSSVGLRPSRAFAYRSSPELLEFAAKRSADLGRFDY